MKCKKCGAKIGKYQFCNNCGAPKGYVPAKGEKIKSKKRSVIGMILCLLFTFIISFVLTMTMSLRDILKKSFPDEIDNIKFSEVKIGSFIDGFEKDATLTDLIASFIDDPRMTNDGIAIILDSDALSTYIKDIAQNYNDVLFNKGDFKELSSQDVVSIVKSCETDISSATSMPFSSIGDIIYNDIDKTMAGPLEAYNDSVGDLLTGLSVVIIRFIFSNSGIITGFVILAVFLIISAICFKRVGNGIKSCGITTIIPSLAIFTISLLSAFIEKFSILNELLPSIKPILMQYGLIVTGYGILEIVIGIIFITVSDKIGMKKSIELTETEKNYDELYPENENEKVPVMVAEPIKSDSFSDTGKIPVISENNKICPICGAVNNINAKFCRNCSSKFEN